MWIISEEKSINLDNVWRISLGANSFHYDDSCLIFEGNGTAILDCVTFENTKEMLKEINQAIYDGKKTFNFDAHLDYIEKVGTKMIKFMKFRWAENEALLRKRFENMSDDELNRLTYKDLVKYVCEDVINTFDDSAKYIMGPTVITARITEIDDGDYSGTLLFTIPFDVYDPSHNEYFMTYVEYGSCSCCDTLQGIYYMEREEQINDYMKLCKDIASNFIVPYNAGWKERELFKEATVNDQDRKRRHL